MSRPHVEVNVQAAFAQRGSPTATGTAMMAFYGGSGATTPVLVTDPTTLTTLYGSTAPVSTFAQLVTDCLSNGAPAVIVVKVATSATTAATVTKDEWVASLAQLTGTIKDSYGSNAECPAIGQVAIPGVSSTAAHDALAAHVAAFRSRTAFLDWDSATAATGTGVVQGTAATLAAGAATYAGATGAERIAIVAPPITMQGAAASHIAPASVIAMALAARGDAVAGHTNNAPAGDQRGRGAGVVTGGIAPVDTFTQAERNTLNDAGVSVFRMELGVPMLYGWASVSTDTRFHQLSAGRFAGQLASDIDLIGRQFLFLPLDSETFGLFRDAIRDYLARLRELQAIWTGLDGTHAGFLVEVAGVNTAATIAAKTLVAAVAVSITPYTEQVVINVTTSNATEVG